MWIVDSSLLATLDITSSSNALAAPKNNQEEAEAKALFQQVAYQTHNPQIAHMALKGSNGYFEEYLVGDGESPK